MLDDVCETPSTLNFQKLLADSHHTKLADQHEMADMGM